MEKWNSGMMGYWVYKRKLSVLNLSYRRLAINPTRQYLKAHYSAKDSLRGQYSIIPTFQFGRSP